MSQTVTAAISEASSRIEGVAIHKGTAVTSVSGVMTVAAPIFGLQPGEWQLIFQAIGAAVTVAVGSCTVYYMVKRDKREADALRCKAEATEP